MPKQQPVADSANIADAYRADLALIHDAGFGDFAAAAAEELIARLRALGIDRGQVVDLGCGSGILARAVTEAGYDVLGVDLSAPMLRLARRNAPQGRFRRGSFLDARLPACVAVTAVGEVFNYLCDARNSVARLRRTFARVRNALQPGGLFLFDVAAPGRAGASGRTRGFTATPDWACLYAAEEDRIRCTLTRAITTFRRVGRGYRRDDEVHRLRLYPRGEILTRLRAAGMRAQSLRGYGSLRFPPGWSAFVARKP